MKKTANPAKDSSAIAFRVYYEDTDAGGIVYHANHLKFAERGRTEVLRAAGYDHQRIRTEFGLLLIVKHIEVDYQAPAKLDDLLEVKTEVLSFGNTSLTLKQSINRDGKVLADMKVVIVAISPEGKPTRWPPQLRQIFLPSSLAEG